MKCDRCGKVTEASDCGELVILPVGSRYLPGMPSVTAWSKRLCGACLDYVAANHIEKWNAGADA